MITWNTELIATSTAAASRSPQARSFQMMTIAMQRARPTMIRPVRYSGRSGSSSQARANISAGPSTQFRTSERDQQLAVAGDGVEAVVADLGQHRVHHDQQAERDRQRDAVDLDDAQRVPEPGDQAAEQQAGDHGDADPHRQEPVEDRHLAGDGPVVGRGGHERVSASAAVAGAGRCGQDPGFGGEHRGQLFQGSRDHPVVHPGAAALAVE